MVVRVVQELFRTAPTEILAEDIPHIMKIVQNIGEGDEAMVRTDLLEQIPHMASQAMECSNRVEALKNVIGDYLIPLVVRNLGCLDNALDKVAHTTLITLLEQNLITKQQAEIQVCPAILALSNEELTEISTGAITLMSKMAPLLGRDITERVFLNRFSQLCSSTMFYVRKVCASQIGDFCAVVGKETFEKILLPNYVKLCEDYIWGVRKSCAEVIIFVSSACPLELRRTILAPTFAKLFKDECRWVQIAAFQSLGPFIATFADPPITGVTYHNQRELVFVDKDGNEYSNICPPAVRMFMPKQPTSNVNQDGTNNEEIGKWFILDKEQKTIFDSDDSTNDGVSDLYEELGIMNVGGLSNDDHNDNDSTNDRRQETDKDIKEIVETVKNAVLSYRNLEQEPGALNNNLNNINNAIDCDIKGETCDNLNSTSNTVNNDLNDDFKELTPFIGSKVNSKDDNDVDDEQNKENNDNNQVILYGESDKEDDNLQMFNSYNYWYISPDMPVDLSILDEGTINSAHFTNDKNTNENNQLPIEQCYNSLETNQSAAVQENAEQINMALISTSQNRANIEPFCSLLQKSQSTEYSDLLNRSNVPLNPEAQQDIVPQVLIDNFVLMSDSSFAVYIDNEMSYHCAYSLPAVVLTLGRNNWPLLKNTVGLLASDMQFKVRRTVASSLHELAAILGTEITTKDLTPIFEGFIKDLDEVRIGILKNLSKFLYWIKPAKRRTYLPRLSEFYDDMNWRFRHELARQLMLSVPLFKPKDLADIAVIADVLLDDNVSAVRQVAISLVTELTMYFSKIPGLNSRWLIVLSETCAHSKKWKKRQTFASLCFSLLSVNSLPPEQFAVDIMPHLLDLSWDPVANVRLVVARTISKHIITNEYFSDPSNQHIDSLGTVLRRLRADKDRDVRYAAEGFDNDAISVQLFNDNIV